MSIQDNRALYDESQKDEIVKLYVTTFTGSNESNSKRYTLDDLNKAAKDSPEEPNVQIIVREGLNGQDSAEGSLGYNATLPNARMQLRGQSARVPSLKSFKIKLYASAGTWRGQNTLNLNKHYYDSTRVKQKFCFDYMSLFPDMVSLRTNFVQLFIKDATKGENSEYIDYGLFTHIEQPNRDFLAVHGLDSNGNLYKPRDFEFHRLPDIIRPADDPLFNKEAFSKIFNIREGGDNEKLIAMLADVNNYQLDIQTVFTKYFNLDNYLTWIAMNILFDNYDTMSRNYMLYNASNSNKWFFLPWDYDKSLVLNPAEHYAFFGVARYWGTVLHRRFLKNPNNVALLNQKLDQLMQIITQDKTTEFTDAYIRAISGIINHPPDSDYLYHIKSHTEAIQQINQFHELILNNYRKYHSSNEKPMPIFLGKPTKNADGGYTFNWDPSYDLQGDMISYNFQVSQTPDFSNVLYERDNLHALTTKTGPLISGIYYWRVIISDNKGNTQIPFDYVVLEDYTYSFGISKLVIETSEP
jgi:spore coat protein H